MRKIGSLRSEQQAKRFGDYLLTKGIDITVDSTSDQWTIWVYDEDQIEQSKLELEEYLKDSEAEKYQNVSQQADLIREEKIKKARENQSRQVNVRETWNQPFTRRCPVTALLIGISVVVFLLMQMDQYRIQVRQALSICSFQVVGDMISYDKRLVDIRDGEIWRLVTPIFIHFGDLLRPFHILFNGIMTYQLGGVIETTRGSRRLILLVLATAIPSNLAQFYWGGPDLSMGGPGFGGLSGVVYGMFGYMWMKSKYDPQSSFHVPPNMVFILIGWFFLCMTGFIGNIANMAHAVGLGTGMAIGVATTFLRQSAKSR